MLENSIANSSYGTDQRIDASLSAVGQVDGFRFVPTATGSPTHVDGRLIFALAEDFDPRAGWKVRIVDSSNTEIASVDTADLESFGSMGSFSIDVSLPKDLEVTAYVSESDAESAIYSDASYQIALVTRSQETSSDANGVLVNDAAYNGSFGAGLQPQTFVFEVDSGASGDSGTLTLGSGSPDVSVTLTDSAGATLTTADANVAISGTSMSAGDAISFNLSSSAQAVYVAVTPESAGSFSLTLSDVGGRSMPTPILNVLDRLSYESGDYAEIDVEMTEDGSLRIGDIFSVIGDAETLYVWSQKTSSALTLSNGSSTSTLSNSDASPTAIPVSDLYDYRLSLTSNETINNSTSNTSVNTVGADRFQLNAYARSDSVISDVSDAGATATTSGVIAANIDVIAEGVTTSLSADTVAEGTSVDLTLTLVGEHNISFSLSDPGGDLTFGTGLNETTTVALTTGSRTATVQVNATGSDGDFAQSEAVSLIIDPIGYDSLLISPITLSVTEDVPQFELAITEGRNLVGTDDVYRIEVTLTNSSDFNDGDVEVTLNTGSGFLTGLLSDALSADDVVLRLGGSTGSDEILIGQDTSSQSLLVGTMDFDVTVSNNIAPSSISDVVVTRVAATGLSAIDTDIPGSSGDDVFFADESSETVTGLAGDDSLAFASVGQLNESVFDGGDGNDTVILPGERSDYDYTEEGSTTTLFVSDNSSQSVSLTHVELVQFGSASAIAINALNSSPVESDSHTVTSSDFSVDEGSNALISYGSIFTDADGDALRYRVKYDGVITLPTWISVDEVAQTISLAPQTGDTTSGTNLSIEVTDRSSFALDSSPASVTYSVVVSDVNNPPSSVTAVPNSTMLVASAAGSSDLVIDLDDYYTDIDGDAVSYALAMTDGSNIPSWVSLTGTVVTFDSSSLTESGVYQFTLTATDDSQETNASTSESFTVSVVESLGVDLKRVTIDSPITLDVSDLTNLYGLSTSDLNVTWQTSTDRSVWSDDSSLSGTGPTLGSNYLGKYLRASVDYVVDGSTSSLNTDYYLIKPYGNNLLVGKVVGYDQVITATDAASFEATLNADGEVLATTAVTGEVATFLADQVASDGFEVQLASSTLTPSVNITDAVSVLKHIVGISTLNSEQQFLGDLNGDGQVNITDAVTILKQIVGIEAPPNFVAFSDRGSGYTTELVVENGFVDFQVGVLGDLDSSSLSALTADIV